MSRRLLLIAFGFVSLFLFLILGAIGWYTHNLSAPSNSAATVLIEIPPQASIHSILTTLSSHQLIRSVTAGKIYLRLNSTPPLRPGSYMLPANLTFAQIVSRLSTSTADLRVTFPEGWRREQYAQRLAAAYSTIPGSRFNPEEFVSLSADLEGQLFPDTYSFPASATAADIIKVLQANFAKKSGLQLPADEAVLILASLLERETRVSSQRPTVAGVLSNRLSANWFLNIDATVQYAVDSAACPSFELECPYWAPLTSTAIPSAFNTYTHLGLPPHPIANPGLDAITAAQSPQATPYMFYLHDATGEIHYATTLEEHNRNVDTYLKI